MRGLRIADRECRGPRVYSFKFSVFLNKFDLKCNQILIEVLIIDKKELLKQIAHTKKIYFFIIEQNDPTCNLFVEKSIWTSRLISSKGVITFRCFNQWDDNQEWVWVALPYMKHINFARHHQSLVFTSQVCGRVSCPDQKRFLRTSERVLDAHWSGKGYKTFSKDVGLHQSTVRQIVYKWRKLNTLITLSMSGCPKNITLRVMHTIIQEVTKTPG